MNEGYGFGGAADGAKLGGGGSDAMGGGENGGDHNSSYGGAASAQSAAAAPASPNQQETNGGGGGGGRDDICRDYLNNVCFRGQRCRYYHPPPLTATQDRAKEMIKDFCHDYQNKGCARETCRYVHCGRDDMEEYNRTGKVTESLARALVAVTGQEVVDGRPLCKEYLSGHCSRSSRCRFWHINPREERDHRHMERVNGGGSAAYGGRGGGGGRSESMGRSSAERLPPGGIRYESPYEPSRDYDFEYRRQPDYKRPRLDDERDRLGAGYSIVSGGARAPSPGAYSVLQEENIALRRKIDVLKQTVAELSAANDNMIAENARLRAKLQVPSVGGPPSVSDTSIVASALSSVLTSASQGAQAGGLSAGIPAEHLAVSLAAVAQQSIAAAQQSMAMSAPSDVVHWSVLRR